MRLAISERAAGTALRAAAVLVALVLTPLASAPAQVPSLPRIPQRVEDPPDMRSCPPAPPPPSSSPVCGNGLREDAYAPICPPCVPNQCCTCGWAATRDSEECDATDMGGSSCESLGFLAGSLSCDDGCRFDRSACSYVSGGGRVDALPGVPAIFVRRELGLARNGNVLGLAVGGGPMLTFYAADATTLAPLGGPLHVRLAEPPEDALAEWRSPKGPLTTTGSVVMAPFGDGFVAAVQRFGKTSTAAIVRIRPGLRIEAPHATVAGRPEFLVVGHGGALLGYTSVHNGVELLLLGPEGAPVAKPSRPFSLRPAVVGQLHASALTTEDGWLVATGSDGRLGGEVAHVAANGVVSKPRRFSERVAAVKLAHGSRPVVVFGREEGLFAIELSRLPRSPQVRLGEPVQLSEKRPMRLVDAATDGETLTVWAELEVGVVSRITHVPGRAPVVERAIAVPALRPVAEAVIAGTLHVLLANEPQTAPPLLYRGDHRR